METQENKTHELNIQHQKVEPKEQTEQLALLETKLMQDASKILIVSLKNFKKLLYPQNMIGMSWEKSGQEKKIVLGNLKYDCWKGI